MRLKNFTPYLPLEEEKLSLVALGYEFLQDEDGNDWYEVQSEFLADTLKLAYYPNGKIDSVSFDASALVPRGLSVVEIDKSNIPEGFFTDGEWLFNGDEIVPIPPNYLQIATGRRDKEMAKATARINALVEAQDDGDITPEEEAELADLRALRTKLRRLDLSTAPDIAWPDVREVMPE